MMVAEDVRRDRKGAFLRLFEQYTPALERLAGAYAATREDREDLLQEIAAALWRALPAYRGDASERTWVYRIAHNVAITESIRLRKREKAEIVPDDLSLFASAAAGVEQRMLADEKRRLLLEAVRGLPVADRHIAVLHLEGLRGGEIEEVTGVSEGAVATRLTRIREKLRKAIRAKEAEHER